MKILVLLLATLATANAMENFFWLGDYADEMGEVGKGCCLPTQWEGRVGSIHVTKKFLHPKVRASDSKVGVDFQNQKVAARSTFYCAKTKKTFETRTVADFGAKKAYFIFQDKCKVFRLNKPLNKPCIPDFFRQFPAYTYGAAGSSLALTPYGYRNGSLAVFTVVTRDSCVPIKGAFKVKRGRHGSMGSSQYYNITIGNTDRDLYNIPTSCNGGNLTRYESQGPRGMWRKFKKFVGYTTEEPFSQEEQLGDMVQGDLLTQLTDILNSNAALTLKANDHQHRSGRDREYQRRWGRRATHHRRGRDEE